MSLHALVEFMVRERAAALRAGQCARVVRIDEALRDSGVELVELADRATWVRGGEMGMVRLDG